MLFELWKISFCHEMEDSTSEQENTFTTHDIWYRNAMPLLLIHVWINCFNQTYQKYALCTSISIWSDIIIIISPRFVITSSLANFRWKIQVFRQLTSNKHRSWFRTHFLSSPITWLIYLSSTWVVPLRIILCDY